jgi:ribose/xylose/arabinose/galactoside ABC-type transport system permease subunit
MAFLAALCFTARNSSVSPSSLDGLELQVIVATVLGGTQVQGGRGSLIGTLFGVLLIAVLEEGLRGAAIWGGTHLPFKISHLKFLLLGIFLVGGVWLTTRLRPSKLCLNTQKEPAYRSSLPARPVHEESSGKPRV